MKELSFEEMESILGGMTWAEVWYEIWNTLLNYDQYHLTFTNLGGYDNWTWDGYRIGY